MVNGGRVRLRGELSLFEPRGSYQLIARMALPAGEGYPKTSTGRRTALANWLTHPKHPLTARVTVNRYWQMVFGTGIVKTSENFGTQADLPSHPALLDWLASEFVRSGWDVKGLLRTMVTSATYRQSAEAPAESSETAGQ